MRHFAVSNETTRYQDHLKSSSSLCEHIPSKAVCHACTIVLFSVNLHTRFDMASFTHSKKMIVAQKIKMGHLTLTTPIKGSFCLRLTLEVASNVHQI